MTWLIGCAVAVVAFCVGFIMACLLGAAKFSDMLSANEFLREEVERWMKEYEALKASVIKHVR